jgi:hypothetical protein
MKVVYVGLQRIQRLSVFLFVVLMFLLVACSQSSIHETVDPLVFSTPGSDFATDASMFGSTVYVVGQTYGTLDGQNLGSVDAIVRRYSYDGVLMWGRQFGTTKSDAARFIATDWTGSAYVLGDTFGTLTRQGNLGFSDIFLRKYDSLGNVVWTRQFGFNTTDYPFGIAIDNSYVYVASRSYGVDYFSIRKYTLEGNFISSFSNTGPDYAEPHAFTKDTLGNFYVLVKNNTNAAKLFKYDPNGTLLWSRVTPPNTVAFFATPVGTVITDSTNAVYISWTSLVSIPGSKQVTGTARVRKYNANGTVLFTRGFSPGAGSGRSILIESLGVDAVNALYIAGDTTGAFSGYTNKGSSDAFVLKIDSLGNRLWTRQFGTNSSDNVSGLALSGRVFVVGYTQGSPNLLGQSSPGNADGYVRSLNVSNGSVIWTDQ